LPHAFLRPFGRIDPSMAESDAARKRRSDWIGWCCGNPPRSNDSHTGSNLKRSPQRFIRPQVGDGKCAVQNVDVSHRQPNSSRRDPPTCGWRTVVESNAEFRIAGFQWRMDHVAGDHRVRARVADLNRVVIDGCGPVSGAGICL
jgi:hypothetical protein